ncbi:DGQHR domain-containing protein [Leuconostoc lactis]|uniref:DGQHR domain-containing protein n=1 Tax=Leuconostoc lactis TaxID=1246 RepID=UPI0021A44FD1|nr:DGQHR domain-containing protein [Leuconostoc lactis]MCT3115618.1 DGQHR domain-containing protein [Leuconostoc lactis]
MMNTKKAFKYTQAGQTFYSTILTFAEINNIAEASIYGQDNPLGYQRKISETHLTKMVISLQKGKENISPNAIILGVYEDDINSIISSDKDQYGMVNIDFSSINNKIFRIIDGQHRIAAIKKAITTNQTLINMPFNVIICAVSKNELTTEVDIFTDINSKSKRLRTDLTIMAKYNMEIQQNTTTINILRNITIRTIIKLNNYKSTPMLNSVKIDPNDHRNIGSVSIKAVIEAIYPIIKTFLNNDKHLKEQYDTLLDNDNVGLSPEAKESILKRIDYISEELTNVFFVPMWDIVFDKWNETFYNQPKNLTSDTSTEVSENKQDVDEDEQYFYNTDYYIQQTIGIKSLGYVVNNIIHEFQKEEEPITMKSVLLAFEVILNNSKFSNNNWKKFIEVADGGKEPGLLRGMSSEAGFRKIADIITERYDH